MILALLLAAAPPVQPATRVVSVDGGTCLPVSIASVPAHGVYLLDAGVLNVNAHPVSVSNFPATQPVSLASVPTHAVTGTFWQATQPVSLASVPTHGVTGTFWQATQPVSVAATIVTQEGSATRWSCFKSAITATTECQAAPGAGQRLYVTSVSCSNGAATVQGVDIVHGTGSNCATNATALTHKYQMGTNATTTSPFLVSQAFVTPLVPPQNVAICVRPTAATAFGCTLTGFTAP